MLRNKTGGADQLRRNWGHHRHVSVNVFLVKGIRLSGYIKSSDKCAVLNSATGMQTIYKHAISMAQELAQEYIGKTSPITSRYASCREVGKGERIASKSPFDSTR